MAKTKVSRKELLKKPDEFLSLSTRAIIFVKEHSRLFSYIGIVAACLVLLFIGVRGYVRHIEKKGQATYSMAYHLLAENTGDKTDTEDLQEPEELFRQVVDDYGLSKAARLALPELGYLNFLEEKYDTAIFRYQEFLKKVSNEPYPSLSKIALAVCYEEKGEYDRAIQLLDQIRSGPDDFFKEQAMLSMARIFRLTGKKERSNEILKEFVNKFQSSPFLPIAKAYIKP
jgi:predicted negative regulator of RcsB-dependent stress response